MIDFVKRDSSSFLYKSHLVYDDDEPEILTPLIPSDHNAYTNFSRELKNDLDCYVYKA